MTTKYTYRMAKIETTALFDLGAYKQLLEQQGADGYKLAFAPMVIPGKPAPLEGMAGEPNMLLHWFIKEEIEH